MVPGADSLPSAGGAYALHFRTEAPLALDIPRLGAPVLAPGVYVYAGSAFGPGGIRARVTRHLRTGDRSGMRPHWHVDRLSAAARCIGVEAYPGGSECDIVAGLIAGGATVPVPGFGSSDCRTCAAHLLRLAAPRQNRDIARQ
jgi:Uri superfamily endonuclease